MITEAFHIFNNFTEFMITEAFPIFNNFTEFIEVFRYKIQQGRLIKIIQDNISICLYSRDEESGEDRIFRQSFIYEVSKYLDDVDMKLLLKSSKI